MPQFSGVGANDRLNRFRPPHVDDCHLDEFIALVSVQTKISDVPYAKEIAHGAVVYDAGSLRRSIYAEGSGGADGIGSVLAEINWVLEEGPGIVVFRDAVDTKAVDAVTEVFFDIVAQQRAVQTVGGDHFGNAGVNDRVWNALEKLAVANPEAFIEYYANDMIALGPQAWLGPLYQMTSQVNVVNPGGAAQKPHRDYHFGFLTEEVIHQFPLHAHLVSPKLTLQGAIAHCDMPIETGPTTYLPHSQKYPLGYLAWRRPDFAEYYDAHHTQVPLSKGDLVYFNPALFHAAGTNQTSDVRRIANLLQVNSAFGRAMESIDRERMCVGLFPALSRAKQNGMHANDIARVIASCAEGYAFPTNLDVDQPVGRLTPQSQAEILIELIGRDASLLEATAALGEYAARRRTR